MLHLSLGVLVHVINHVVIVRESDERVGAKKKLFAYIFIVLVTRLITMVSKGRIIDSGERLLIYELNSQTNGQFYFHEGSQVKTDHL